MFKSSTFLVSVCLNLLLFMLHSSYMKLILCESDFTHLFICIPPAILAPLVIKLYGMQFPLNVGFLLQHKPLAGINLSSSLQLTVKIENQSEQMIFLCFLSQALCPDSIFYPYILKYIFQKQMTTSLCST